VDHTYSPAALSACQPPMPITLPLQEEASFVRRLPTLET
jgi:hypothetical protein